MRNLNIWQSYNKIFLLVTFILLNSNFLRAQNDFYVTPGGVLDKVFDRYGTSYQLSHLQKPATISISTFNSSSNRFAVYFEVGSGMEDDNNILHLKRRQVLTRVLEDVSNFIDVPVSSQKVNIWIRNFNNMTSTPNNFLSKGSSFYCVPKNTMGQITDAEVWKTILSGKSSYTNLVAAPNNFYHGVLAFNFGNYNNTSVTWNTNLLTNPTTGVYDLYTIILKEVMHLLGVTSLINPYGESVFGAQYKYYSRYDRSLRSATNVPLLKFLGGSNMLNYSFNNALSPTILRPGCTMPNFSNPNEADATTCSNALRYRATGVDVPVYTPTCFEVGSSFSCLEDQHYPSCNAPNNNNRYFVMSNKLNTQSAKRYPRNEERRILALQGYKLKNTFGTTTTLGGFLNYGTATLPAPQSVVGVNDGLNNDLTFSFSGNVGQNFTFNASQLLANDSNATSFDGLENITAPGSVNVSSGNSNTSISINSTVGGINILRYIPKNKTGQSGNVTYFYVVLNNQNNCGTPEACNLVINGGFEQYSSLPDNESQVNKACNWSEFMLNVDYFHSSSPSVGYGVPNNVYGNRLDSSGTSNGAYVAFRYLHPQSSVGPGWGEIIRTELQSPLIANKQYQLSFKVSKSDLVWSHNCSIQMQAFLTSQNLTPSVQGFLTASQISLGTLLINQNVTGNSSNWETISFTFTASGGEKYLYLGGLTQSPNIVGNGNFTIYYLDQVVLNDNIAIDDIYTFSNSSNIQTSIISSLANDEVNGNTISPPFTGYTVMQVGNTTPTPAIGNITINSTGNVVIAPNTTLGTYILQYKFVSPCGESNTASITVNITTNFAFYIPLKFQYLHYPCFSPASYSLSVYNLPAWQDGDFGQGILINNEPISPANTTVSLAPGQTLPNGVTFNSTTGQFTFSNNAYGISPYIYVVFCSVQDPSICTPPIGVAYHITDYFFTEWDVLEYSISANAFLPSNPTNVLTNDRVDYCYLNPNSGTPAILNVNCTLEVLYAENANVLNIDPNTGNIMLGTTPIIGDNYFVTYRLCHPTISSLCDYPYGSVIIKFVN
jgi:hypothetical protein